MAVISSSRFIILAISCFCLIVTVACRPQSTIDSQDASEQDNSDIRRLYNSVQYGNYPGVPALSQEDRMTLNRLAQLEFANYVQNGAANGMNSWSEGMFRSPEIKRQVRYRQCYFNPISCFRK